MSGGKPKTVAERLTALRTEYGLSAEKLASLVGVTRATIDNIERGASKPYPRNAEKIAKKLGSTAEWLLHGKGEMLPGGKIDIVEDNESSSPYRDYLVQKLEKEVEDWKTEYQWMKQLVNDMRNGGLLGKLNPVKGTARRAVA